MKLESYKQSTISTSNINFSAQLDFGAFLKASQAIAAIASFDYETIFLQTDVSAKPLEKIKIYHLPSSTS